MDLAAGHFENATLDRVEKEPAQKLYQGEKRRRRAGAINSVELLLLLPILVVILFGSLQLSFLFAADQRLEAAAQAACRVATLPMSDRDDQIRLAREAAEKVLQRKVLIKHYQLSVEGGSRTGEMVTVEMTIPMKRAAPNLLGSLLAINDRHLQATVTMRRE